MATPKEQHDARSHAMSTGSWRHAPDAYDQQRRAAAPDSEAAASDAQEDRGRERAGEQQSRPADPDVPSSEEP
jgi:hypothetical protein